MKPEQKQRPARDEITAGNVARKTLISIIGVLVLGLLAGWLFREQLATIGQWLVGNYGWRGIFLSVFVIDWVPMPATNEPVLLLGVTAGMPFWKIFWAAGTASVVAACASYVAGDYVDRKTSLAHNVRMSYPKVFRFVKEKGVAGIAVAALVPLPFSVFCWTAGIVHLPFAKIALVSLLRLPKTLFYLWLIHAGWTLT